MELPIFFAPPRRKGLIFQIILGVILLVAGLYYLLQSSSTEIGGSFLLYLFLALVFLAPVPLVIYRTYSLLGAHYVLERDGLRIHWGLRTEDIPLPEIEWVRMAVDLPTLYVEERGKQKDIPLPLGGWPGALLGERSVEGLGPVEYLASEESTLTLVATARRIYAISPENPREFLRVFYRIAELGSLTPFRAQSQYPAFLLSRVWADRAARSLLLGGLGLGLLLLVWVALAIPANTALSLGFTPAGLPGEAVPAERLLLLPVLDGLSYLVALGSGLFFYRRLEHQPIAYFIWAGNVMEAVLLLAAVGFITL